MTREKYNNIEIFLNYFKENGVDNRLNQVYQKIKGGKCTGCGKCCNESVGINRVEFLNIYNFFENLDKEKREKIKKSIIKYYFFEYIIHNECPFKEDNKCLIYEVRPLNCRIFGNWTKEDYLQNLENVNGKNKIFAKELENNFEIAVSEEVVNYKIEYCENFEPFEDYMEKPERLGLLDEITFLELNMIKNIAKNKNMNNIDMEGIFDYKDKGIVEYFIEDMMPLDLAYKIKINITKEKNQNKGIRIVRRLEKLLSLN